MSTSTQGKQDRLSRFLSSISGRRAFRRTSSEAHVSPDPEGHSFSNYQMGEERDHDDVGGRTSHSRNSPFSCIASQFSKPRSARQAQQTGTSRSAFSRKSLGSTVKSSAAVPEFGSEGTRQGCAGTVAGIGISSETVAGIGISSETIENSFGGAREVEQMLQGPDNNSLPGTPTKQNKTRRDSPYPIRKHSSLQGHSQDSQVAASVDICPTYTPSSESLLSTPPSQVHSLHLTAGSHLSDRQKSSAVLEPQGVQFGKIQRGLPGRFSIDLGRSTDKDSLYSRNEGSESQMSGSIRGSPSTSSPRQKSFAAFGTKKPDSIQHKRDILRRRFSFNVSGDTSGIAAGPSNHANISSPRFESKGSSRDETEGIIRLDDSEEVSSGLFRNANSTRSIQKSAIASKLRRSFSMNGGKKPNRSGLYVQSQGEGPLVDSLNRGVTQLSQASGVYHPARSGGLSNMPFGSSSNTDTSAKHSVASPKSQTGPLGGISYNEGDQHPSLDTVRKKIDFSSEECPDLSGVSPESEVVVSRRKPSNERTSFAKRVKSFSVTRFREKLNQNKHPSTGRYDHLQQRIEESMEPILQRTMNPVNLPQGGGCIVADSTLPKESNVVLEDRKVPRTYSQIQLHDSSSFRNLSDGNRGGLYQRRIMPGPLPSWMHTDSSDDDDGLTEDSSVLSRYSTGHSDVLSRQRSSSVSANEAWESKK